MAFMPFVVEAAGLGRLTVISGLGEPLNAEIELISTTSEELSSLTASIAPEEAYAIQGIERSGIHNAIKIDVDKNPSGTPILKLSTRQPVSEPFLDMLIQVDWATGRLLREYTVLLDPPGYDSQSAPNTDSAPVIPQVQQAAPAATNSPPEKMTAEPLTAATDGNPIAAALPEEHETVRGDTLNSIAREMQVEGISLEQTLVGLYRANKNAFVDGNMNRLKVGEIIRAPDFEALESISQQQAAQEIRVQTADWNAYRDRLAGIVADSAPASEDQSNQSTSGKITAPAEDQASSATDAAQDVVKLSKSDSSTAGASKNLQDKLNALQEEAIARENGLKEANERTAALEKQIQDMQQLLAIKNQALADMQQSATDQNAGAANQNPSATPAEQTASELTPQAQTATSAATPAQPKASKPAGKSAVVTPPAAAQGSGIMDDLLQNQFMIAIAAGALLLLGVIWLLLRNKRRRELDSFEKGILTSGGLKANTVFGNTSGDTVDTGDTSFLTDFSQSTGGMIDTHDVDPIAEAEVYMAYGRDAQAEEILKDAIAKEPKRYELHLKLLEIFAARNDVSSFETIAGELYSTLGANDANWVKVAEIGRKLEPDNPLYTTAAIGAGAAVALAASPAEAEPVQLDATDNGKLADDLADAELISSDFDFTPDSDAGITQVDALPESNVVLDLNQKTVPADYNDDADDGDGLTKTVTVMNEPQTNDINLEPKLDFTDDFAANTVQLDMTDFGHTVSESDLPAFDIPELQTHSPDVATEPKVESALPDLNFELPTAPQHENAASAMQDLPSLDFTTFDEAQADAPVLGMAPVEEKIVFEAVPEQSDGLSFDMDNDLTELPASINNIPEMDLSGISLELNDASDASMEALSGESAEVNTKIDLIGAYLDMDDIEGARELLEEVLKEGGPNQRQHAQKLLDGLA